MPLSYATEKNTKAGDYIRADGGFRCFPANEVYQVQASEDDLEGDYIICPECNRRHYLAEATDARGRYIGFHKVGLN